MTNTPLLTPTCVTFSSVGFTTNDGSTNFYQGFVFTVPVVISGGDRVAYSLYFDMQDSGKTIQLGIYADASNSTGTLLGSTNATLVNSGWNQVYLTSPVYLVDGQKYWLGYMFYDGGYTNAYYSNPTYQIGYYSNSSYGSLPSDLTGAMSFDYWYHAGIYAGTCP